MDKFLLFRIYMRSFSLDHSRDASIVVCIQSDFESTLSTVSVKLIFPLLYIIQLFSSFLCLVIQTFLRRNCSGEKQLNICSLRSRSLMVFVQILQPKNYSHEFMSKKQLDCEKKCCSWVFWHQAILRWMQCMFNKAGLIERLSNR